MVVSNPGNPLRQHFFTLLAKRRPVDSGGRVLNNVGGPVLDKFSFIRNYRFCIAFENSSYPGYTTEKLMEAKHAGCIPIYWGNPLISRDFNPRSFVNLHDFSSIEACIERVFEIDSDPVLLESVQREPLLPEGRYGPWSDPTIFVNWLTSVLAKPSTRRWKELRPLTRWFGHWSTGLANHQATRKYL